MFFFAAKHRCEQVCFIVNNLLKCAASPELQQVDSVGMQTQVSPSMPSIPTPSIISFFSVALRQILQKIVERYLLLCIYQYYLDWLRPSLVLCHITLIAVRAPRLHKNVVMCCMVMWGLSSTMISYLHSSILPQEAEMNSPKTACGCPHGGVMKTVTRTVLLPCGMHLSAYSCICWGTCSVQLGNAATTTVQFKMVVLRLEKSVCAAHHLSEVSPLLPFKWFQCLSN